MWLIFALSSALFSGATAVIAKFGVDKIDSDLAVALRTVIMMAVAWLTVLLSGDPKIPTDIGGVEWIFLLLSGAAAAFSWLFYFKALKIGTVDQVAATDKASSALTMLGGWLFLNETMNAQKTASIVLILSGAWLMAKKQSSPVPDGGNAASLPPPETSAEAGAFRKSKSWLYWGVLSALFTTASTLFSKAGMKNGHIDFALAIRTSVVFILAWAVVLAGQKQRKISKIPRKSLFFVGLSGLTTGLGWVCYFRALGAPTAEAGIVQPIDKLGILISIWLSKLFFGRELSRSAKIGLVLLVAGIVVLIL